MERSPAWLTRVVPPFRRGAVQQARSAIPRGTHPIFAHALRNDTTTANMFPAQPRNGDRQSSGRRALYVHCGSAPAPTLPPTPSPIPSQSQATANNRFRSWSGARPSAGRCCIPANPPRPRSIVTPMRGEDSCFKRTAWRNTQMPPKGSLASPSSRNSSSSAGRPGVAGAASSKSAEGTLACCSRRDSPMPESRR